MRKMRTPQALPKAGPDWQYSPPRVSKCGRYVELDAAAAFGLVDPKEKVPRASKVSKETRR